MTAPVSRWIAFEYDESGWPKTAYVVVAAESREQARAAMDEAIRARASLASPALRRRLFDIFIEAPTALRDDDPRNSPTGADRVFFSGFDS